MIYPKRFFRTFLVGSVFTIGIAFGDVKSDVRRLSIDIIKTFKAKVPESVDIAQTLGVMNLKDASAALKKQAVGEAMSALLISSLSQSPLFKLVEREQMAKVAKEIALGESGLLAEGSAAKAGNLSGAEYLLVGSVSEVGENILVSVNLVFTEKGEVLFTKTIELKRSDVVAEAASFLASTFQSQFGLSLGLYANQLFSLDPANAGDLVVFGTEVGYSFHKNFGMSLGFIQMISYGRLEWEEYTAAKYFSPWTNSWDVIYGKVGALSGSGVKVGFDVMIPLGNRAKISLRGDVGLFPEPRMRNDYRGFPVSEISHQSNLIDTTEDVTYNPDGLFTAVSPRGVDVEGYGNPLWLFGGQLKLEFLVSRRVSLYAQVGYYGSTRWVPTYFKARGNVQDSTTTWNADANGQFTYNENPTDEEKADFNGKFGEFFGFNFARDSKGNLIDYQLSAISAGLGIGIHF